MADIYDISDLQTLERFARREGYSSLSEYLPVLRSWNIDVATGAELVRRGISFSEYSADPSLLEEELPENVVRISDLYRARDERIAQERISSLEEMIPEPARYPKHKEPWYRPILAGVYVGLSAAAILVGISSFPQKPAIEDPILARDQICSNLETAYVCSKGFLQSGRVCIDLDGQYVCRDRSELGAGFGAYIEERNLREELRTETL